MDKNIIRKLRKEAEVAWLQHCNRCSEEGVWKSLNISLYDISTVGLSWRLKWIEERLDELIKDSSQQEYPGNPSHI